MKKLAPYIDSENPVLPKELQHLAVWHQIGHSQYRFFDCMPTCQFGSGATAQQEQLRPQSAIPNSEQPYLKSTSSAHRTEILPIFGYQHTSNALDSIHPPFHAPSAVPATPSPSSTLQHTAFFSNAADVPSEPHSLSKSDPNYTNTETYPPFAGSHKNFPTSTFQSNSNSAHPHIMNENRLDNQQLPYASMHNPEWLDASSGSAKGYTAVRDDVDNTTTPWSHSP